MATTQLRRSFRYPTEDSDDDDTPNDLDEEEQESFIRKLQEEDKNQNQIFKRILLAFPALSALTYLPTLFISELLQAKLLCFFSITSLIITTYILTSVLNANSKSQVGGQAKQHLEPPPRPIHQYISFLNGGLSVLILLNAYTMRGESGVHEGFWLLCTLPSLIFSVIVVARQIMLGVDVTGLEDLKYEYKGA